MEMMRMIEKLQICSPSGDEKGHAREE